MSTPPAEAEAGAGVTVGGTDEGGDGTDALWDGVGDRWTASHRRSPRAPRATGAPGSAGPGRRTAGAGPRSTNRWPARPGRLRWTRLRWTRRSWIRVSRSLSWMGGGRDG